MRNRRSRALASVAAVVALLGATTACVAPNGPSPLRYRDEIFPSVTKTSNLVYGSAVNYAGTTIDLTLDLYEPTGDTATRRPAAVWVHGGSFSSGNKSSSELVDQANVLSRKGYVNVSINYRLDPRGCSFAVPTFACVQAVFNAQHDAQAAVRWLRANAATYRIDPNRIAIGGSSAGAVTALQVAYRPFDPGTSGNPGFSSAVQAAQSISGTSIGHQAGPGAPPAILFHNEGDGTVPYALAQETASWGISQGAFTLLQTWSGNGHVPYSAHRDEVLSYTANLFYFAMDLAHAEQ